MKKTYINPLIKMSEMLAAQPLAESLPKSDDEVPGESALGKDNAWDDEVNITPNLWDE